MSSTLKSDVRCLSGVAPSDGAMEVTVGRAESNGNLLPGIWRDSFRVTCGLIALQQDRLWARRSFRVWANLYLFSVNVMGANVLMYTASRVRVYGQG